MLTNTYDPFRIRWFVMASSAALFVLGASPVVDAQERTEASNGPPVIFDNPLPDAPGKRLVVVELDFSPNPAPPSTADRHGPGHRHPGSVYVHVVDGSVRLALEGQPVEVVHAGEGFFEPPNALHVIMENASATEPAKAIAVMLVPDGEHFISAE